MAAPGRPGENPVPFRARPALAATTLRPRRLRHLFNFDILLQQVLNGLVLGSVYALVALGYTMVYGILQLINFAHGEVLMIGAMAAFTVLQIPAVAALPGVLQMVVALLA